MLTNSVVIASAVILGAVALYRAALVVSWFRTRARDRALAKRIARTQTRFKEGGL